MGDYGFRISADGVDVKSGDDKDMIVTSKYSMLKGTLSGSGTITVARDATEHTVTIAHGLSYIPMVQAFMNDQSGSIFDSTYYLPGSFVYFDGFTITTFKVKADATNIYITFAIEDF